MDVVTEAERDRILNRAVAAYAREGWTISAVFSGQAVAQRKRPIFGNVLWINVLLAVIVVVLVLVTAGLFLIILLVMYLSRDTETVVINVDEYGHRTTS